MHLYFYFYFFAWICLVYSLILPQISSCSFIIFKNPRMEYGNLVLFFIVKNIVLKEIPINLNFPVLGNPPHIFLPQSQPDGQDFLRVTAGGSHLLVPTELRRVVSGSSSGAMVSGSCRGGGRGHFLPSLQRAKDIGAPSLGSGSSRRVVREDQHGGAHALPSPPRPPSSRSVITEIIEPSILCPSLL